MIVELVHGDFKHMFSSISKQAESTQIWTRRKRKVFVNLPTLVATSDVARLTIFFCSSCCARVLKKLAPAKCHFGTI